MKDNIPYFPHDSNARNDEKLLIIRSKFDYFGYGWYFAIIELLRESSNYTLSKNVAMLQLCLGITESKIEEFNTFFNLCFDIKLLENCINFPDRFYSESLMERMSRIDEKRQLRAEAGRLGGIAKRSNAKTKLQQNDSKGVANKEEYNIEEENKKENKKEKIKFSNNEIQNGFNDINWVELDEKNQLEYLEQIKSIFLTNFTFFESASRDRQMEQGQVEDLFSFYFKKRKNGDDFNKGIRKLKQHFLNWLDKEILEGRVIKQKLKKIR
jgi:hypothetical protein